jgi:hypothetical protein
MVRIQKISPLSLAYTLALLYLVFGIFVSLVFTFFKTNQTFLMLVNPSIAQLTYTQIFLIYPLAYAIGGFASGLVIAFSYNISTRLTKGIEIELSEKR